MLSSDFCDTKCRYENIDDRDQEDCDSYEIINFISFANIVLVLNIIPAVQHQTDANKNLKY